MSVNVFGKAVKWAYVGSWGEKAFSTFFTFFLAAILGPRDFGIVSIATIYILFLQMLLDQGLAAALVQRRDLEPEHLNAAFWMNIAFSGVLVAASILLSNWWAQHNHAPAAAQIISALSLCIPIEALSIVQRSILMRRMDFRSLSIRSNLSVIVGGIAGVLMALGGWGMWSLVGQQIVRDITSLALLWRLSEWRPGGHFSLRHLRDLMHVSVPIFVAVTASFADIYGSSIVLGLFFGPVAVGLYRLADRMVSTITVAATTSMQAVSLPEFSRHQLNPEQLRRSALNCLHLSSTIAFPTLAGIAAVSPLLLALLGAKWVPAAPVVRILCIGGIFSSLSFFTGPLLQALAKVKLAATLEWSRTLISLSLLVVAGFYARSLDTVPQLMVMACTRVLLVMLLVAPFFVWLLLRITRASGREFFAVIAPASFSALACVAAVFAMHLALAGLNAPNLVRLALELAAGIALTLATLASLDREARSFMASSWNRLAMRPSN